MVLFLITTDCNAYKSLWNSRIPFPVAFANQIHLVYHVHTPYAQINESNAFEIKRCLHISHILCIAKESMGTKNGPQTLVVLYAKIPIQQPYHLYSSLVCYPSAPFNDCATQHFHINLIEGWYLVAFVQSTFYAVRNVVYTPNRTSSVLWPGSKLSKSSHIIRLSRRSFFGCVYFVGVFALNALNRFHVIFRW